jgi:hypothetical protein
MPRLTIKKEITFSFEEADKLVAFMEQISGYGCYKTGKTPFDVMDNYDVLGIFHKLRYIVWNHYDKASLKGV